MLYDWEIVTLSEEFYKTYTNEEFPEIMKPSGNRKYCLLLYEHNENYYIAVPFRSHIKHNNGFLFRHSERSRRDQSGLDYSKTVIMTDDENIGNSAEIDSDEFKEFLRYLPMIQNDIFEYIEGYKAYVNGNNEIEGSKYELKYTYSTLKYFHEELELEKAEQCEEQE